MPVSSSLRSVAREMRPKVARRPSAVPVALIVVLAAAGCGGSDPRRPDDGSGRAGVRALSDAAVRVGAAVDITRHATFLPRDLSDEVLDAAGVDLPDGVRVTDYERAQSPSRGKFRDLADPDDYWQFCLVAADGSWVTYADTTGVQDFSSDGTDPCTFTGRHHRDAPTDVRLAAQATADVANGEVFVEKAQGPDGDDLLRDLVTDRLPGSWRVSEVDRRGIAYQYCVTTPDADWFLIQGRFVVEYGNSGSCRLDPDLEPEY